MKFVLLALFAFAPSVFAETTAIQGKPARRLMVALQRAGVPQFCDGRCFVEITNLECVSSVETPEEVSCELETTTNNGTNLTIVSEGPHALNLQNALTEIGGPLNCGFEACSLVAASVSCESFAARTYHCSISY